MQFPRSPRSLREGTAFGSKTQKRKHTMTTNRTTNQGPALGQLVSIPGTPAAFTAAGQAPMEFLSRHVAGNWGQVSPADAAENELSVKEGFRILSAYPPARGEGKSSLERR
jgi:hypothetical protein